VLALNTLNRDIVAIKLKQQDSIVLVATAVLQKHLQEKTLVPKDAML